MRRFRTPAHSAHRNRGFALIAFVLLLVLVAGYMVAAALNRTGSELASTREDRNMKALQQAKAALISYAASEQWQRYKGQSPNQPGGLPCPDTDPDTNAGNTGVSSGICSSAASRVGRLPFATIGSDDLRDASGERLWYAVSSNFYKNSANVINSDTQGLLNVDGIAAADKLVAIVFAPGLPIEDSTLPGNIQDRNSANYNRIASYLECFTPPPPTNDYKFASSAAPSALPSCTSFNDRLLAITQAELMASVEPVVAARIERDIKPYIQTQFIGWGNAYPFAAPFLSGGSGPGRPQLNYNGVAGQENGLLPLTADTSLLLWKSGSVSLTAIPGGGTGNQTIISSSCSIQGGGTLISCQINYNTGSSDRPAIQLQATLLNAALGFVKPVAQADKIMTDSGGNPIDWSSLTPTTPTISNTLSAGGDGVVAFRGGLRNGGSTGGQINITVPVPSYHAITNTADTISGWFIANQWYRQTYFAVSPAYLPGGGGTCNTSATPPLCLTVNNQVPPAPNNKNKIAILVFSGRALNGASRPTTSPSDYFENANLAAANGTTPYVYEHRASTPSSISGTLTSINDRVVVLLAQ